MRTLKSAKSRGEARFPGVHSRHTFSFGSYHDPDNVRVSVLRVINDDRVEPRAGFPTHGHRDMEIISYVLDGELAHRDSLGNAGSVRAGEIQVMSAGTGITHSEFNASDSAPLRFLQIWIEPDAAGHAPAWQQIDVGTADGALQRVVGPRGSDAPMTINQDASLFLARPGDGPVALDTAPGRLLYVHATRGRLRADDMELDAGDALALDAASVRITALDGAAEALIFDLPAGPVALH